MLNQAEHNSEFSKALFQKIAQLVKIIFRFRAEVQRKGHLETIMLFYLYYANKV